MKKYSLIQILEASFAAHRINGDYYRDTRRFSEDVPTQFSNKECIGLQFAEEDYKIPNDWQPMKITEEDTKNSIASVEWINKAFALQVISDTLSDYMKQLMECINSKELSINEFGIVAPLPRIYFEGKRKKALKSKIKLLRKKEQCQKRKKNPNQKRHPYAKIGLTFAFCSFCTLSKVYLWEYQLPFQCFYKSEKYP